MDELLSDKIIVELTILQGKDMTAMDRNGYSDPFCVVSVKGKKVFTTTVKKKTLFPKWNETVTTEMSLVDSPSLTIDVFDKDVISKDFMGKLTMSIDQLKELSIKSTPEWFTLDKIKSGKLQLRCQVIAKDTLSKMKEPSKPAADVFEYPPSNTAVASDLDVTDSSIGSPEPRTDQTHINYNSLTKTPIKSGVKSSSDQDLDKRSDEPDGEKEHSTMPRKRSPSKLVRSDSINSVSVVQRSWDQHSVSSSTSLGEKVFSVSGKVLRVRGTLPAPTKVYCKIRLEIPGNRLSLFHHSRIIGKSQIVSLYDNAVDCCINFEVDRGAGITVNAVLTFDIKYSNKQHLATKNFSLKSLLADGDNSYRWIPIGKGVEIEISISQGQTNPHEQRRSGSILKSMSFRKEKSNLKFP